MKELDNTADFADEFNRDGIETRISVNHAARGTAKAVGFRSGGKYIVSALAETHRLEFGWLVSATSELSKYNNGNHTYKVLGPTEYELAGKKASSVVNRNMSLSSKGDAYWAKGIHSASYGLTVDSAVTGDITYLN